MTLFELFKLSTSPKSNIIRNPVKTDFLKIYLFIKMHPNCTIAQQQKRLACTVWQNAFPQLLSNKKSNFKMQKCNSCRRLWMGLKIGKFILLCQVTLLLYKNYTLHLGIVDILLIHHIYAHPLKFHTVILRLYVIRAPNPAGNLVHFFSSTALTHKINENGV